MLSLVSTAYHYLKALLFFPITHICVPVLRLCWLIFKHTVAIPALLTFRTFLFTFVYVPLTPLLVTANVSYDANVPVEVWLYRLVLSLRPHVALFLVHLTHYFMISLFMGTTVGIVAGFNIGLVSRLFNVSETHRTSSYVQTTPFVDKLANRPSLKVDNTLSWATSSDAKTERGPRAAEQSPVKVKTEYETGMSQKKPLANAVDSKFGIGSSNTSAPFDFKNTKTDLLEVLSRQLYEDDDGYGLMGYDDEENTEPMIPARNTKERRRSKSSSSKPTLVDMIIEEETEKEVSPIISAGAFVQTPSAANSLGLPTLASTETNTTSEAASTSDAKDVSSALTANSPEPEQAKS